MAETLKILHIEEDELDAGLMQAAMCSGVMPGTFSVTHVSSLRGALDALAAPDFDAILLDMHLADLSGPDNVRIISGECPHIPVIMLSTTEREDILEKTLSYGAQHYLEKSFCDGARIRDAITSSLYSPEATMRRELYKTASFA